MTPRAEHQFKAVINDICTLNWASLTREDTICAAAAYYYFSIQFRENLEIARRLYPEDEKLIVLEREECNTSNLSPWPTIAVAGEKMNHDEFMRRLVELACIEDDQMASIDAIGGKYLSRMRAIDPVSRAASIASYEDGGLERVFRAMLDCPDWGNPALAAFRHFLTEHIRFDSDPDQGHGALSRHLEVNDQVLPCWQGFMNLLVGCVPALSNEAEMAMPRFQASAAPFTSAAVAAVAE